MTTETMNSMNETKLEAVERCVMVLKDHAFEEWVRVGLALKYIRDNKAYELYAYENFAMYCKGVWDITRKQAEFFIENAELRLTLDPPYTGWTPDKKNAHK